MLSNNKKVVLYEQALNDLADWDLPESEMGATDDNGAAAKWARDLLKKAGAAPDEGK